MVLSERKGYNYAPEHSRLHHKAEKSNCDVSNARNSSRYMVADEEGLLMSDVKPMHGFAWNGPQFVGNTDPKNHLLSLSEVPMKKKLSQAERKRLAAATMSKE